MKKLVSLCLALAMCLAVAIPVLATEETFDTENSNLLPTVEVVIPDDGVVILNPYGMTYTPTGTAPAGIPSAGTTNQIISNFFHVTNKTQGAKLKLSVAFTGVVAGEAELEEDAAVTQTTGFAATETGKKVILDLTCGLTNTAAANAPTTMPSAKTTVRVKSEEQKFADLILDAATSSSAFTYVTFQFSGKAVEQPETPWGEEDLVGATFVFTFEPAPASATASSSVTVAS